LYLYFGKALFTLLMMIKEKTLLIAGL